jgi:hypothetical protein
MTSLSSKPLSNDLRLLDIRYGATKSLQPIIKVGIFSAAMKHSGPKFADFWV